jgi:hypothetical protein
MLSWQNRAARDESIGRVLDSDESLRCRRVFCKKRGGAMC